MKSSTAILIGALLSGGCATSGGTNGNSVESAAISDVEQLGVTALATKLGVSQGAVSNGLSFAKSVYNNGGRTAAAKESAVQQGTSKIVANAKAEGKTVGSDAEGWIASGLTDLLK